MSVESAHRAGRREWVGLIVLGLPTMLVSLDLSVLFLALPHLSADLGAGSTQQLWITDIYGFMTAGFLVTMGTLGDRIGRRKLLLTGAVFFSAASLFAAYAPTAELLILARGLLGVAGAAVLPTTLALIRTMFPDPKQMGVAIAGWTTAFMAGVAIGPVIGGALLDTFWWGSVFLLGVPVMLVLLISGPFVLPEHREAQVGRIDLLSVVLSLATILPTIYGLKEFARVGFEPWYVLAVAVGISFGVVFVLRQRRLADPFLDLRLFRIATLRAALVIALVVAIIVNGNALAVALYLQTVERVTPLHAGLLLAVPAVALILTINATPHLARRVRPGFVFAGGLVVSTVGLFLMTMVGTVGGLAFLILAALLVNAGTGPSGALTNQLVLGSAPPERAGSAVSLAATSGDFGIAFGVASFGTLATVVYQSSVTVPSEVPPDQAEVAGESVSGAVSAAEQLSGSAGAALLEAADSAFTTALNTVGGVGAALMLAAAVFTVVALRHVPRTGEEAPAPVGEEHDPDGESAPADDAEVAAEATAEDAADAADKAGQPRP